MNHDLPATCPTCGAAKSHDAPQLGGLRGRVYQCGATIVALGYGEWDTVLYCAKVGDIISAIRADNVRLGDRNVLLATELKAIADAGEQVTSRVNPSYHALRRFANLATDLAVEALEGQPAAEAASAEPGQGGADVEQASAAVERAS